MLVKGNLSKKTITASQSNFSLKGMNVPSFTNKGESPVMVDGVLLAPGENFSVYAPGVILQNEIDIQFTDDTKTKMLFCHWVSVIENTASGSCTQN
ncbi:hypothetical protein [Flavobacterium limnosediminis]|uniref:hypothetical protein n=1 Tax=Flavobacterium limnosediminis TaxID=1401027 RepID=UPI00041875A5|nr:hypothetical protein [Flavobacterium limnosediminis]